MELPACSPWCTEDTLSLTCTCMADCTGGDLRDWGTFPQSLRWGTAHVSVPQYLGNMLCTLTKHVMHTYIMTASEGFVNAFQANTDMNMTKKDHQNFWVENRNVSQKKVIRKFGSDNFSGTTSPPPQTQ